MIEGFIGGTNLSKRCSFVEKSAHGLAFAGLWPTLRERDRASLSPERISAFTYRSDFRSQTRTDVSAMPVMILAPSGVKASAEVRIGGVVILRVSLPVAVS